MYTHREKCRDCGWRGYHSDLKKRYPTDKENKKYGANNQEGKKYICCPSCGSFNVKGYELDDDYSADHLQGV